MDAEGLIREGIIRRPSMAEEIREMSEADARRRLLEFMEREVFGARSQPDTHA